MMRSPRRYVVAGGVGVAGLVGIAGAVAGLFGVTVALAVAGIGVPVVLATSGDAGDGQFPGIRQLLGMARGALRASAAPAAGDVPAGAGWRLMGLAARLMPPAAGRRWLGEAESFLTEAPAALCRGAIRSYLAGAPQVVILSWTGEVARRARISGDRPR